MVGYIIHDLLRLPDGFGMKFKCDPKTPGAKVAESFQNSQWLFRLMIGWYVYVPPVQRRRQSNDPQQFDTPEEDNCLLNSFGETCDLFQKPSKAAALKNKHTNLVGADNLAIKLVPSFFTSCWSFFAMFSHLFSRFCCRFPRSKTLGNSSSGRMALSHRKVVMNHGSFPRRSEETKYGTEMWIYHGSIGGFLEWWYPTTMGFPTQNDYFGVFGGYHYLRKHPLVRKGAFNVAALVRTLRQPPRCEVVTSRFMEVLLVFGFWNLLVPGISRNTGCSGHRRMATTLFDSGRLRVGCLALLLPAQLGFFFWIST